MPDGNTLAGAYGQYVYTDDKGTAFKVRMLSSLATAGGFALVAANATTPEKPKRMKMRYLLLVEPQQGKKRKRLHVAAISNAKWTNVNENVDVDGIAYKSVGRVGERNYFALPTGTPTPSPSPTP